MDALGPHKGKRWVSLSRAFVSAVAAKIGKSYVKSDILGEFCRAVRTRFLCRARQLRVLASCQGQRVERPSARARRDCICFGHGHGNVSGRGHLR